MTVPLQEEARVVLIRFGSDADPTCMQMDEVRALRAAASPSQAAAYRWFTPPRLTSAQLFYCLCDSHAALQTDTTLRISESLCL